MTPMGDIERQVARALLEVFRVKAGDTVEVRRLRRLCGEERVLFHGTVHRVTVDDPEGMLYGRLTVRAYSTHNRADCRRFDLNVRPDSATENTCVVTVDRPTKLGLDDDHGRFGADMYYALWVVERCP